MTKPRVLLLALLAAAAVAASAAYALHSNYPASLAKVLLSEGGNDDDPLDPGGRTSRGIIQREWNVWRKTHPGLPADVWHAPQDQIEAIYKQKYWDVLNGDEIPAGLDLTTFDYGVNSGISRSGRVLRQVLGLPTDDWHVTDEVIAALKKRALTAVIRQVNDERMAFLHRLSTCPRFCPGWTKRVNSVKAISLKMAGQPADADLIGWKTPVDNAFVRYVPTTPQPSEGKATDEPIAVPKDYPEWMEQHENPVPHPAAPKIRRAQAPAKPRSWFDRLFGHEAPP